MNHTYQPIQGKAPSLEWRRLPVASHHEIAHGPEGVVLRVVERLGAIVATLSGRRIPGYRRESCILGEFSSASEARACAQNSVDDWRQILREKGGL